MPSLGEYCQGVITYWIACPTSPSRRILPRCENIQNSMQSLGRNCQSVITYIIFPSTAELEGLQGSRLIVLSENINYPTNSDMWIHKHSIHVWTHKRNLIYDSLEFITKFICHISLLSSIPWIQNIEFSLIFSYEFISQIHVNEIRFMNSELILGIHRLMNSYMNTESIHLTWIYILMNSYIHFIQEFI